MALQYVGGASGVLTASTGSLSLTSLTGGIGSSPQSGDFVIVYYGGGGTTDFSASLTCSGDSSGAYTAVSNLRANDTYDTNLRKFYASMGATPDASVNLGGLTYSAAYGNGVAVQVWRGVDPTTPLDGVADQMAGITNAATIGANTITPATSGAVIIYGGANCQTSAGSAVSFADSNYTVAQLGDGTTSDYCVAVAAYTGWTSGAYTTSASTGGTSNTSCSAIRTAMVIKPAPDASGFKPYWALKRSKTLGAGLT